MNLLVFGIGILICLLVGIVLSYLTDLNWLSAALLVYAALHFHAAALSYTENQANAEQSANPERPKNLLKRHAGILFWLRTLLITFLLAGAGAYLQIHNG